MSARVEQEGDSFMSGLTTSDSLLEGLAYLTPPAPIPEVFRF